VTAAGSGLRHGQALMQHLERWAKDRGCGRVVLYSGPQRDGAHRFWEDRMGYERRGVVFKRMLD